MSAHPIFIIHQPTFSFFPVLSSRFKSSNPFPKIPFSNSVEFLPKRSVLGRNRITMTELVRASAFSSSSNEEDGVIGVNEEDTLINGSSKFVPNNLQFTLNRLSKWLVAGLFSTVILWRHDAEALWAAAGSVLNLCLSITLKKILSQERPVSTLSQRSGPGMPSSHAQSIFYTFIFAIHSMIQWRGVNALTLVLGVFIFAFGSYLSWLRVSQQLHTPGQVVVGAIVGSTFSILWFWSWDALVLKAFVSSFWVRVFVVLGAVGFCIGFLIYVIRYWFKDER